jgi:alcohol dehydrogenase class IV
MTPIDRTLSGKEFPPLEYDFFAPPRIVFGWGRRQEIGPLAATLGRRAFVVAGSRTLEKNGVLAELLGRMQFAGLEPLQVATVSHEPEVSDVDQLSAMLVDHRLAAGDLIIGVGGGAAIDLAKAAAAMATNRESDTVTDYLEGVGRGKS